MAALPQQMFTMGIVMAALVSLGQMSWSKLLLLALCLILAFLFALYRYQENLLFQPKIYPQFATPEMNPPMYRNPGEHGLPYEDVYITTSDNLILHAWFVRPVAINDRKNRPTILFFHANAGNMGFRLENIVQMYNKFHVNVLILSYRGYGNSEGTPTEDGLMIDAETAWSYLADRPDVDTTRIIVFGRSLGGAVAIALANKHPSEICGMIVENTFTSISDMVDSLFPYLKWAKSFVLKLNLPSKQRIGTLTAPILFLSGLLDEVVPSHHMRELFEAATQSRDKRMETFEKGMHNTTWQEGGEQYATAVATFINSCIVSPATPAQASFRVESRNAGQHQAEMEARAASRAQSSATTHITAPATANTTTTATATTTTTTNSNSTPVRRSSRHSQAAATTTSTAE